MSRSRDFYLMLLSYALVEVRFLEVEGDLTLAPKLADMLHHLPEALRFPWDEDRDQRAYAQLRAKAEAHGLTDLLDRWEARVERRLQHDHAHAAG